MIDIKGIGPIWVARAHREYVSGYHTITDDEGYVVDVLPRYQKHPFIRTVWFREADPPFRHGVGVVIGTLSGGLCARLRDRREDYGALGAHDLQDDPEAIGDWMGGEYDAPEEVES